MKFEQKRIAIGVGLTAVFLYTFGYTYIPMQDYPDWIYQGFLFKELLLGNCGTSVRFVNYLPPNSSVTVIIGLLGFLLPLLYAAKAVLFIAASSLFLGIGRFLSLGNQHDPLLNYLIAFVLTFNFSYFHGNISFVLGLGVAFLCVAYLTSSQQISRVFIFVNLFLYATHFFSFVLFNAYMLAYSFQQKRFDLLKKIMFWNLPVAVIFLHYYVSKEIIDFYESDSAFSIFHWVMNGVGILKMYMMPIPLMKGIHDGMAIKQLLFGLNVAAATVYLLVIGYAVAWGGKAKTPRLNYYFMLALLVIFLLLPVAMSGVVRPGERLLIFIVALALSELLQYERLKRRLFLFFALTAFVQFTYINYMTYDFNTKYSEVMVEQKGQGEHRVFLRKRYYEAIEQGDCSLEFFPTGVLKKFRVRAGDSGAWAGEPDCAVS